MAEHRPAFLGERWHHQRQQWHKNVNRFVHGPEDVRRGRGSPLHSTVGRAWRANAFALLTLSNEAIWYSPFTRNGMNAPACFFKTLYSLLPGGRLWRHCHLVKRRLGPDTERYARLLGLETNS